MARLTVSTTKRHAQQTALERIRHLAHAGHDVAGFLNEVNPIIGQVVPNGTETIDSPFWFTLDPESELVTSIYGQGCDVAPSEYMQWELLAEDYIKTAHVLAHPRGALTLHEVTEGEPERSPIYVEVMEPNGMAQELLVALRSATGEPWGTARLNRKPGEPMFTDHEIDFMTSTAPVIADGVRRGLLVGEASDPEGPDAPGVVTFSAAGDVVGLSPGAEEWFERLPDDDGVDGEVPASVLAAATGARRDAGDRHVGSSSARVPTSDGRWAMVHGAVVGSGDDASVTVIIQPAHPDRIAPLLMSIYGLTERERELTQLVLRGGSTTELAKQMDLSPHTVQQHFKSIFAKTEVNSRGELIAKVYFDFYDQRAVDNRERIQVERAIRGGPKRSSAA